MNRHERRKNKKLWSLQHGKDGGATIRDDQVTDDVVAERVWLAKEMLPMLIQQGAAAFAADLDNAVVFVFDQADEGGATLAVILDAIKTGTKDTEHLQMLVPGILADARRRKAAGNTIAGGGVIHRDTALQVLEMFAPEHADVMRRNQRPVGSNPVVIFAAGGISSRVVDRATCRMIGV